MRICCYCKEPLEGRIDKKYCSDYCKSAYYYELNKDKEITLFKKIDNQLKLNRRLLNKYNKAGKATIRKEILVDEGFNPNYFTHYYKNKKGQVYLFCYEFGFLALKENGKNKYLLIKWQDYMNRT